MAELFDGARSLTPDKPNRLFYGDNLTIMQHMSQHSVDLIYLDPPFNSKQNYNLMYKTMTGKPVPEQVEAFCDTWEMDAHKDRLAETMPVLMRQHGIDDSYIDFWNYWIKALRNAQPHLLAYLIYMVQRLIWMKGLLRPTGAIYLHCDPTASHYIKVMMDGIFGHKNFLNEIIWKRTGSHGGSKRWGPVHDVILFYGASENYTWNRVFQEYDQSYLDDFYRFTDTKGRYRLVTLTGAGVRTGDSGKEWRGVNPTDSGRHWAVPARSLQSAYPDRSDLAQLSTQEKLELLDAAGLVYWPARGSVPQQKRYADENPGVPVQDIISDIGPISSHGKERLGYPTQKPISLLKRIIEASTMPGDIVFDPFCGCGTTIYAAHETGRRWVGCDIAILSIKLVREVLGERYKLVEGSHFEVDGIPVSVEQAGELFKSDPFQFQHWIVERAGGFPMQKKVADQGVDGRMYFETKGGLKEMVLSVKGGKLKPADIRDLRGVLEANESFELAGFLSLQEPTKAMRAEAAKAGVFNYNGVDYQRIQFLTAKELLEDKREFHTPTKIGSRITTGQASLPL